MMPVRKTMMLSAMRTISNVSTLTQLLQIEKNHIDIGSTVWEKFIDLFLKCIHRKIGGEIKKEGVKERRGKKNVEESDGSKVQKEC